MASTKNRNARNILGLVTPFNYICACLGAASIMFVILGGEKPEEDVQVSFLAGMTFLVGSVVLCPILIMVSTLLNFTYRRAMYEVDQVGAEVSKKFPILLGASPVMMTMYIVQFVAGVILWFKSKYPDWCIVVIVAEVFVMSGIIILIAVKAGRSDMKPYS